MAKGPISGQTMQDYQRDGFILAKGMFDREEIDLMRRAAKEDRQFDQHAFGRGDGEGGTVRLSLWNHPGDTIYGMFARCESIVNSAETLLEGEVYHYHSKMIMKDAKVAAHGPGTRTMATGIRTASSFPSCAAPLSPWTRRRARMAAFRSSVDRIIWGGSTTF